MGIHLRGPLAMVPNPWIQIEIFLVMSMCSARSMFTSAVAKPLLGHLSNEPSDMSISTGSKAIILPLLSTQSQTMCIFTIHPGGQVGSSAVKMWWT